LKDRKVVPVAVALFVVTLCLSFENLYPIAASSRQNKIERTASEALNNIENAELSMRSYVAHGPDSDLSEFHEHIQKAASDLEVVVAATRASGTLAAEARELQVTFQAKAAHMTVVTQARQKGRFDDATRIENADYATQLLGEIRAEVSRMTEEGERNRPPATQESFLKISWGILNLLIAVCSLFVILFTLNRRRLTA
jgi:CHASE3 domain sensor protein